MPISNLERFLNTGLVSVVSSDACPICLDTMTDPVQASPCPHVFCRSCITEWLNQPLTNTCAMCRRELFNIEFNPRVLRDILHEGIDIIMQPILDQHPENRRAQPLIDQNLEARRTLAGNALRASGLASITPTVDPHPGTAPFTAVQRFDLMIPFTRPSLVRAAASALQVVAHGTIPPAQDVVQIRMFHLGAPLIAMGNMIPAFAAQGNRSYTGDQARAWRVLVSGVWRHLRTFDGQVLTGTIVTAVVLALLQRDFEGNMLGPAGAFFRERNLRLDLDMLVHFVVDSARSAPPRGQPEPAAPEGAGRVGFARVQNRPDVPRCLVM